MRRTFMDKDFLLSTPTAQELYHRHAEPLPIIDYHCHLDPRLVAEDHRFENITELWLGGDHYKWRAMRWNGVDEYYITGNASPWEKFEKWAETVPYTLRNPLYHWTHLELRTAFGINKFLNSTTARQIYEECNEKLRLPEFSARGLMRHYNVEVVCTTDDPVDNLRYHKAAKESGFEIKMLPTWRPDRVLGVDNPEEWHNYANRLALAANHSIDSFPDFIDALELRHDYFAAHGCKLSDHGLTVFYADDYTDSEINRIYRKVYDGNILSSAEIGKFRSAMLYQLARMDAQSGWAQQFHYGTIRNANARMFRSIGPDTGFDSIGEYFTAESLVAFLSHLDEQGILPKTILYNLNPAANEMIATMAGNFQDGITPGKVQFGSGWWFNDQKDGIQKQINALSLLGLLSRFVGMLTDSRSFLSYPRHEYFRRILCEIIGNDIQQGEIPIEEMTRVCQMVEDISYYNAKNYFKF